MPIEKPYLFGNTEYPLPHRMSVGSPNAFPGANVLGRSHIREHLNKFGMLNRGMKVGQEGQINSHRGDLFISTVSRILEP